VVDALGDRRGGVSGFSVHAEGDGEQAKGDDITALGHAIFS
jgi:hypothetical protein